MAALVQDDRRTCRDAMCDSGNWPRRASWPRRQGSYEGPKFFTASDLVERWNVSRWTIQRLVKEGRLKPTRVAGTLRFSPAAVDAYERKVS